MNLTSIWTIIKVHAKTVAAFVAGVVANMIVNLIHGNAVWPQTRGEWIQYALTSFGTAITVWLTRNKITQKQLDKDPNVIGGVVVPDAQIPPPPPPGGGGPYTNPWRP